MQDDIIQFLSESNAIEDERDQDSLDQAVKAWEYIVKKPKLTIEAVLEAHRLLMLNQDTITELEKGNFRTRPVAVYEKGIKKEVRSEVAIKHLTQVWIDQMNAAIDTRFNHSYLEVLSKKMHIHYEHIHPFADGNGRTGRIFMNWFRVRVGLPVLVIHEKNKYKYFKWFKR